MTTTVVAPWANLTVPAADGTPLVVDVHVPVGVPVPVVVTRTPYGRSRHLQEGRGWVKAGYGYVVADVRGRYDSDGTWTPYVNERTDGAALIDWITAQPWCDGRIVTYGGSYSGYTAWAMAVERPDSVRAVISLGPSMSLADTKFDPSGILRLAEHAAWWLERADARTSRDGLARLVFAEQPELLTHLPVIDLADRLGAHLPRWASVIDDGPTDHGPEVITDAELAALEVAGLHVGGWYDLLLPQTLHQFASVGSAHPSRPAQQLILGPWEHDLAFTCSTRVGHREHGATSVITFGERMLDWLRRALLGENRSTAEVFTLGVNRWTTHPCWPPDALATVALHPSGDGTLADAAPTTPAAASFTCDPADPFPSYSAGHDRSALTARTDAVRFFGAPLRQPLHIQGHPRLDLHAGSDGASDWIIRLVEHRPDGRVLAIADGAATATTPTLRKTVTLSAVDVVVPVGARLALEVTGSDFPRLARNLGTDGDRYRTAATHPITQHLHLGEGSTVLHLPIGPESMPS